jgi:hypothetical protein
MTRCSCLVAALLCILAFAEDSRSQSVPFDSDRWEIRARESRIVDHLGRRSLFLKDGAAAVRDSRFTDGTVEFDIAFTAERGFMGAAWRMQDFENFEEFYIRPHQSGNPDANQYQPVFNGNTGWQLYYGEGYAAPVTYEFDRWVHVKIVVSGKQAEIYIKDMETPALFVSEQKREVRPGRVGLTVGNFAPAYFSNFSFTTNAPKLKGKAKTPEPAPAGTVMSWMVSSAFDSKSLEKKYQLTAADKQALTWRRLDCEPTGLANLGMVQSTGEARNTVFASLVVRSDTKQVKKVRFGFSDEVKVFFNDRLIFGGSDVYRSRDYRFLGTMGLYDELYLPLEEGDNTLWFAVTETFGGWGVRAVFDDMAGLRIQ